MMKYPAFVINVESIKLAVHLKGRALMGKERS
jgi:hypothetical protein